jgi:DNA-binding transcriptional regulator GbsR (MarR family)
MSGTNSSGPARNSRPAIVAGSTTISSSQITAPPCVINGSRTAGLAARAATIEQTSRYLLSLRSQYPTITRYCQGTCFLKTTDEAEQIRRDFAAGWGRIGAAWGVTPSTATVQGYLLAHGGPLSESEIRQALGLSHRATLLALADCESWGLIEPDQPRRVGQRGPPARAWVPVGDNWEWFRRVAAVRKERETDPVMPLLDECQRRAAASGSEDLRQRLDRLVVFVHLFDRGIATVVRTDSADLERLFGILGGIDEATMHRLLALLASLPEDEVTAAAEALSRLPSSTLRRLLRLAGQPTVLRLLGARDRG